MLAGAEEMGYNKKQVGAANSLYHTMTQKRPDETDKHIDGKKTVEAGRLAKFIASILGPRVGENPDREHC